jgi:alkylhydroperoxidase/carboxymuconolactone decarboxylase family protein YurZ
MTISDEAQRNHDAFFPNHKSTLEVTDPELVELFDNWAFDEVLRHSVLDAKTRLMVQLAAIIACQAVNEYRVMLGAALNAGVTPIAVKEIVYQAVPYAGMARVFDLLHATTDVLRERGIALPLPLDVLVKWLGWTMTDLMRASRSRGGEPLDWLWSDGGLRSVVLRGPAWQRACEHRTKRRRQDRSGQGHDRCAAIRGQHPVGAQTRVGYVPQKLDSERDLPITGGIPWAITVPACLLFIGPILQEPDSTGHGVRSSYVSSIAQNVDSRRCRRPSPSIDLPDPLAAFAKSRVALGRFEAVENVSRASIEESALPRIA